ncbi:MAG: DUF3800 domain-containing protein [Methanobacteriaceae archaeon]
MKLYTLKKISKIKNSKIFISFIDKHYIHPSFIKNKRQVYNFLAGEIAKKLTIKGGLILSIDKSNNKKHIQKEFNDYFVENLINSDLSRITISHNYSQSIICIQIVDLIAWSYFQKLEREKDEYVDKIKIETYVSEIRKLKK